MRYATTIESAAGLSAGAPIVAITPGAAGTKFYLRKMMVSGYGTTTSQQAAVALSRGSTSSQTADQYPVPLDGNMSNRAPASAWYAWSSPPTQSLPVMYEEGFDTLGKGVRWEWDEREFSLPYGNSGSDCLLLVSLVAVPAAFIYTVSVEIDQ
jgi:hypothetical protein